MAGADAPAGKVDVTGQSRRTRFALDRAAISKAVNWIQETSQELGWPEATQYPLQVCAEEWLANVVLHGGAGRADVEVVVGGDMTLNVVDAGPRFDPTAAVSRVATGQLAEATVGGLGLGLMRQFCEDISYERAGEQNLVTFRFADSGAA